MNFTSHNSPRWSVEEDQVLTNMGENMLSKELAPLLPGRTPVAIKVRRHILGIKQTTECRLRHMKSMRKSVNPDNQRKLDWKAMPDDVTYQVLLGGLLGDGYIRETRYGCRYEEGHGPDQTAYCKWKAKMLSFFLPIENYRPYNYIRTRLKQLPPGSVCVNIVTPIHPIFHDLKTKIYGRKDGLCVKRFFPTDLASQMSFLGLLIWYLDDGTLGRSKTAIARGRKPEPSISAIGLDQTSLRSALDVINEKSGLSLKLLKPGLVMIHREDTKKLFPIWQQLAAEYELPSCMNYKVGLK